MLFTETLAIVDVVLFKVSIATRNIPICASRCWFTSIIAVGEMLMMAAIAIDTKTDNAVLCGKTRVFETIDVSEIKIVEVDTGLLKATKAQIIENLATRWSASRLCARRILLGVGESSPLGTLHSSSINVWTNVVSLKEK